MALSMVCVDASGWPEDDDAGSLLGLERSLHRGQICRSESGDLTAFGITSREHLEQRRKQTQLLRPT